MDQTTPVNVSFIPKALTVIHGLLHEADVAQAMGDKAKEHDKLSEAGAQARVALQELHGLPLWDQLRAERQLRLQQWEDLGLPVIARLLEELGYKPPPPAQDLIDIGNEAVRAAAGLPDQEKPD